MSVHRKYRGVSADVRREQRRVALLEAALDLMGSADTDISVRELQLWVASCLYYGSIDAITRMHGPLTREEELVLLRAGARFGTTLQVPLEMWHQSPEEFWG